MTGVLSHICSLSSQLHYSDGVSDQDYDNQTHDLLTQLRQMIPNRASDTISNGISFLDVSGFVSYNTGFISMDTY